MISFSLSGGGGGFLSCTTWFVCVRTTPVPKKVPVALLANGKSDGNGIVPSAVDVTLNVFVPVVNKVGGLGIALAFLKKKAPTTSPQLSENRLILDMVATAPLEAPVNFAPLTT